MHLRKHFTQQNLKTQKPHLFAVDSEGNGLVMQTLKAGLNSAMIALVNEGAPFINPNKIGITPLMQTVLDGNTAAADFLKSKGAKMTKGQAQKMLLIVQKQVNAETTDDNSCLLTKKYEEAKKIARRVNVNYPVLSASSR